MNPGGRQWQQFLNGPDAHYIEIQAGLARTQCECLPMPANSQWEWLEAYGPLEADPKIVHGSDWAAAGREAETKLEGLVPSAWLESEFTRSATVARTAPENVFHQGSGWGALERLRRQAVGEPSFCDAALVFDDATLGEAQAPWLSLLREGRLPPANPDQVPASWMTQKPWREMLERSVANGDRDNWAAWLHLGVMRFCAGEKESARQAWMRSLENARSLWALRNLAILANQEGHKEEQVVYYRQALALAPGLVALAQECCEALLEAGHPGAVVEMIPQLPPASQNHPRVRLAHVRAALELGDLDTVEQMLTDKSFVIADIQEGEVSLSDLWQTLQERLMARREGRQVDDEIRRRARKEFPVPAYMDFRMADELESNSANH